MLKYLVDDVVHRLQVGRRRPRRPARLEALQGGDSIQFIVE